MEQNNPLLKATDLVIGYKSGSKSEKYVAGPLNVEMLAGQLVCLLGPNGSGKSTLLRTLSGLHNPIKGSVELEKQDLAKLRPSEIAKKLSLVLTDSVKSGNLDVYSVISLGRYPYSGWLGTLTQADREIIQWAIQSAHIEEFVDRKLSQLSDGECQKVMLARALAQDTPVIILDEPTAHLDLPSRIDLMRLLHRLAKETGKAILISTHELDLALQVADDIWLLNKDGTLETGSPEALILNGAFEAAFDKEGIVFDKSTGTFNIHQNGGKEVTVIGDGAAAFWTKRALIRLGYQIVTGNHSDISVEVVHRDEKPQWLISSNGLVDTVDSIDLLPSYL